MIIRDAVVTDAEHLDMLLEKLIQDESQYDSNLNRNCEVKDNYCHRIGLDGHRAILVEEQGTIVGYAYGFLYSVPGIYHSQIAILDALFVDEQHRRKGYATKLISAFRTFAKENGACRLELKVLSNNKSAMALYEKLSFTEMKKYIKMEL